MSSMPIKPGSPLLTPAAGVLAPLPGKRKIMGPKVMLVGEPGHGKTDTIRTILKAGLKVFIFFTEPGQEVLMDKRRGPPITCAEGLHWAYIPPVVPDWKELQDAANLISVSTYKAVSEMNGVNKQKYRQYWEFIGAHQFCKCDRCGVSFGAVDQLEPYDEWCFVLDGLSSLSTMAMNLVIGSKPAAHQGEYGVAMRNLEMYFNKFCFSIPSMAVCFAHIDREGDEVSGGQQNMAATLGKKLAPKLNRPFSDIIHAKRDGTKFTWSTITPNMALKTRSLPFADNIPPDFTPIVRKWQEAVRNETDYIDTGASAP